MEKEVELIGGFNVDGSLVRNISLREVTGWEEDILVDQRKKKNSKELERSGSQRMTDILSRCTVSVGDIVCEKNREGETADVAFFSKYWSVAFGGDRSLALIALRQLSLGDKYRFNEKCPECKEEVKDLVVDLSEMEVQAYFRNHPDEERDSLLLKDSIETILPSGKKVTWKLLRANNEDSYSSISDDKSIASELLTQRIIAVNGKPSDLNTVKSLSASDRTFLRNYFDKAEGGVDNTADFFCPHCEIKISRRINIGHRSFFFP